MVCLKFRHITTKNAKNTERYFFAISAPLRFNTLPRYHEPNPFHQRQRFWRRLLVFTHLTPEILQAAYAKAPVHKITYDECYAIPEGEEGFYLWEPCWLTAKDEAQATALAAA